MRCARSRCSSTALGRCRRCSLPVGSGEKPRLLHQPHRAAVVVSLQPLDDQLLEPLDGLTLPPQLIVEAHHLGDEAGTHVERRRLSVGNRSRPPTCSRTLALARRQHPPRRRQPRVEVRVQLVARHEGPFPDRAVAAPPRVGTMTATERDRSWGASDDSSARERRKDPRSGTRTRRVRRGVITSVAAGEEASGCRFSLSRRASASRRRPTRRPTRARCSPPASPRGGCWRRSAPG